MTGHEKQILSTFVRIMAPISCSVANHYPKSFSCIEFLMNFCIYDDILDAVRITDKKILLFKLLKSVQMLHVDKTSFPRPSHIYNLSTDSSYV